MGSIRSIEEAIRSKFNVAAGPVLHDRVLTRVRRAQEQADTAPALPEPALRRMIMRSSITKLAAAAAIVLAALAGMYALTGSVDGTSITMAQVQQAMETVDWMQVRDKVQNVTAWLSFASKIQVATAGDGKILFGDFNTGKQLIWTPGSTDIYESPLDRTRPFAGGASGPFELVTRFFSFFTKESGWSTTKEMGSYQGRKVEVWTASRAAETPGTTKISTVYIDAERKLPLGSMNGIRRADGSIEAQDQVDWSYPETGPADIYAAGAPKTAQIKPAPTE